MRQARMQPIPVSLLSVSLLIAWSVLGVCTVAGRAEAGPGAAEKAYVDAYIEGLVELGVLTQEQADQLRAKAEAAAQAATAAAPAPKPGWYDKTKVGGYLQFRFNDHPDENGSLGSADNDFQVRRARIKVTSSPTDRLKATLQADLPVGDGVVDVKDAFGDYYLSDSHESWFRFGQAKVPFGFEILQSSSLRLPFERTDGRKAMVPGERDAGGWLYYTPQELHERFDALKKSHLGTGDYGLFSLGLYGGQGFNKSDANDDKHLVFRTDYPFELGCGRLGQVGFSVLTGEFVSGKAKAKVGPIEATVPAANISEHALNFHFYLPPDPWGVQFEYLDGETAGLFKPDPLDPNTWFIGQTDVDSWYGQFHYSPCEDGTLFLRYDEMNGFKKGGYKSLPSLNDLERWTFGYAHQIDSKTELTVEYDDVKKNGKDDDFFGVQWQYKY
ncbi:MAG: porin [Armatimonadota bacterium]